MLLDDIERGQGVQELPRPLRNLLLQPPRDGGRQVPLRGRGGIRCVLLSGCGGGGGGAGASDVPVQQTKAIVGQPGSEGYALNSAEIGRLYGPDIFRQDALGNAVDRKSVV